MFIVILFIFLGIAVGYNVRTRIKSATRKNAIGTWAGRATTGLIWLLLFMLGIEVGSNDQIISALPTLGVEALVLSGFATLGSCALAMMRTKTLKSRIKLTEAALVKLKERYERKSRELLAMKKELQTAQAAEILSALRKSGRSYEELMTFLKG